MFLAKKKGESEEISEDQLIDAMTEADVPKPQKVGASVGADIERIKAQIDAINEMRKSYSEKFTRVSEQIGELRNNLVEKEKDIRNIEAKAVKASDLVESVQPEKLLLEIKKQDVKIESIKSKIESYGLIAEKIREELKEIRDKMSTFRGIDQLVEMNKEVKEELTKMKKIESSVEIHADKVENIFSVVQKRFDEYNKYEEMTNNLGDSFTNMTKEFNAMKVEGKSHASKSDFESLKEDMKKKMLYFDKMINEFKHSFEVMQISHNEAIKRIESSEPAKISEAIDEKVARDEFEAKLKKHKEEIISEVKKVAERKTDLSKARALITAAKKAMAKKDSQEIRRIYTSLKDEYESLSASKKNEIYEDIKRIYDWVSAEAVA